MRESLFLYERLRSLELNVEAFIANRVAEGQPQSVDIAQLQRVLMEAGHTSDQAERVAQGARQAVERSRADSEVDRARLEIIARSLAPSGPALFTIPRFDKDICDLSGLADYGTRIVGS